MTKINFLTEYYKNRASDQHSGRLLNLYLEEDKANGKYPVIAFPTPGLSTFNSGSGSVVRGGIEHKGVAYFVVDNTFYSYASDGTRTSKGTLSTSTGNLPKMVSISNQIGFVDGSKIYIYNTDTNTFTTVSDADAPANPISITAQDGFFLVVGSNSIAVYGSDIADGTSYNALSFLNKNGSDYVSAVVSNKELVYVLGTKTSDTWYNSGAATFSFEPVGLGGFFNYGCAAVKSVSRGMDTVIFLAQCPTGGYEVVMMEQYNPKVVSNRAINYQLSQLTTVSDAIGYCYKKSGHEFYVLTFPTDAVTFMYDMTTGIWSELQSYVSSTYTRHLSNCHVFCYGKNLVGAYNSGKIYYLDDSVYQDDGSQIKRQIITPPGYASGKKVFCDRLQVDMQTNVGSSLTVTLNVSKDSGQTYPTTYTNTIPSAGGRMYWNRLGMTQDAFVFDLSTTVNAKVCILGAQAEIRTGIH
jgi:hypothetical protein